MNWEPIVVTALAIAAGGIQLAREIVGGRGRRARIKQDLEILNQMPDSLPERDLLHTHIGEQVGKLIERERELRQDPLGMVVGLLLMASGVGLAVAAVNGDGVWVVAVFAAAFVFAVFGVVGFAASVRRERRDDAGRVIKATLKDG